MCRFSIAILAVLASLAFIVPAATAGTIDLYGFRTVAGQEYYDAASYFSFKVCKTGQTTGCYQGQLGYTGEFYPVSVSEAGWYDIYMYRDYGWCCDGVWGSNDQPIAGGPFYVPSQFTSISMSVPPRPLVPDLVSPCNYCGVPQGNFYLSWTSGLDAQRTAPNWPVTYEIWTSSTPVGWPQGQEWLAVPDAPCNPDAYGRCRWYVDTLSYEPGAQYTWRIVVKMDVGGGVVYRTSGPTWHLHQNY